MKRTRITLALCATLLAACQQENIVPLQGNYPDDGMVRIATQVDATQTRANDPAYTGSNLSLSIDYGTGDSYTAHNNQWTQSGTTWSTTTPMLWKSATATAGIYAYAPFIEGVTDITAVPFSVATDQSGGTASSDLLGYTDESFVPGSSLTTKNELNIAFTHRLAKLNVTISFGSEIEESSRSVAAVIIGGTQPSITYNATTTIGTPTGTVTDIKAHNSGTAYEAIIIPQKVATAARLVTIWLSNGDAYHYTISATNGHTFAANTINTINLKIGKDKVELDGSITVSDWTDGDTSTFPNAPVESTRFYTYTGDMSDFPMDPADIPFDIWHITLTDDNASLAKVKTALAALNGSNRSISLRIKNATTIESDAFVGCKALTTVELPKATTIGDFAFVGCKALTTVELPEATTIGNYAFLNCTALTTVELPEATTIGNAAFMGCTKLTTVELLEATTIGAVAFIDCTALTTVELPVATTIGGSAFQNCEALTTVELPNATTIRETVFYNCTKLTTVKLGISATTAMTVDNSLFTNCNTYNIILSLSQYESVANGNQWQGYSFYSITQVGNPQ